jgi:hypothetical protein
MDDTASFSSRSNAKRAAEKMIANGAAPAVDYGFKPRDDGRFEIVWKTDKAKAKASPTTDEVEAELAAACEQAEAGWSEAGEAEAEAAQAHPGANGAESSLAANDPAESEEAATAPPPRPATAAESPAADPAAASDPFARIWDPAAEKLEQHKDWLRDQAAAQAEPENQWPEGTRVMVRKGKSWSEATMVRASMWIIGASNFRAAAPASSRKPTSGLTTTRTIPSPPSSRGARERPLPGPRERSRGRVMALTPRLSPPGNSPTRRRS